MNRITAEAPPLIAVELTPIDTPAELAVWNSIAEKQPSFLARYGLFLISVVIPVVVAVMYLFGIAADRYVSEARFMVRSPASTGAAGVAAMIENQGLSRATDETYAVNDYILSRDIVDLLVRNNRLRDVLSRPEADFVNRFPNFYSRDNRENLLERYRDMVTGGIDGATGISTIRVQAFRPDDSRALASAILGYAELLINRLNQRAYDDAERYAQTIVDREKNHVAEIETRLASYRNANRSVDPGKEAAAAVEIIGRLTIELADRQAELSQLLATAPASPAIASLRESVRSYESEIGKQKLQIAGSGGSLATQLSGFEKLQLEREIAARSLALATVNLASARAAAQQQHLYLQTIAVPASPDSPEYPRRVLWMIAVLLTSLAIFSIARSLREIARDHRG